LLCGVTFTVLVGLIVMIFAPKSGVGDPWATNMGVGLRAINSKEGGREGVEATNVLFVPSDK